MDLVLRIDPWWIVYVLLYLLVGALGTMLWQSYADRKASFRECLFWTVFWLPAACLYCFFGMLANW